MYIKYWAALWNIRSRMFFNHFNTALSWGFLDSCIMRHLLFPSPLTREKTLLLCRRNCSAAAGWQLRTRVEDSARPEARSVQSWFSPHPFEEDSKKPCRQGSSALYRNVSQGCYLSLILSTQQPQSTVSLYLTGITEKVLTVNVFLFVILAK